MARPNLNVIWQVLILSIDLNICLAPISDDPSTLTAFSSKSGLPISPTKIKSPLNSPIGTCAPAPSSVKTYTFWRDPVYEALLILYFLHKYRHYVEQNKCG